MPVFKGLESSGIPGMKVAVGLDSMLEAEGKKNGWRQSFFFLSLQQSQAQPVLQQRHTKGPQVGPQATAMFALTS